MTRDHDWAVYEDPVFCRNCGKRKMDSYDITTDSVAPCVGGFKYKLGDAEVDGSIARRLREIQANEGRLALPPGSCASHEAASASSPSAAIPIAEPA